MSKRNNGTIYDTTIEDLAEGVEHYLVALKRADKVRYDVGDDEDIQLNGVYQGTIYLLHIHKYDNDFKVYISDHMLRDKSFSANLLYITETYFSMVRKYEEDNQIA